MATKQIIARVLVTSVIMGKSFEPNSLVKGDDKVLKPFIERNELCDSKEGVEYCQSELGVDVFELAELNKAEAEPEKE